MIVNTTIKNGVAVINRDASFFSLVSASGILRVKLTYKGRPVLETKMWVGMHLPTAMPFDEIILYGDDQPVEFWAADFSMQHMAFSNDAAKALRTNQIALIGTAPLVGSDLTRKAVRVRTDKDIWLGGAGVGGAGWRLPAGSSEEIPVSGVLYGYRTPPDLDMSQSAFVSNADGLLSNLAMSKFDWSHVSDDKSFILFVDGNSRNIRQWEAGSGWVSHPYFAALAFWNETAMVESITEKAIFVFRHDRASSTAGTIRIDISRDEGRTFKPFVDVPWSAMIPAGQAYNQFMGSYVACVGNNIVWNQTGVAVVVNAKSRAIKVISSASLGWGTSGIQRLVPLSEDCKTLLAIRRAAVDGKDRLYKTVNGGVSWYECGGIPAGIDVDEFNIDYSGRHVSLCCSDGLVRLSNDGGDTFITSATPTGITSEPPFHFANGVWIGFKNAVCYSYTILDGQISYSLSPAGGATSYEEAPCQILSDGTMYRREGGNMNPQGCDVWQLSVTGDLSPAIVEVMELLA